MAIFLVPRSLRAPAIICITAVTFFLIYHQFRLTSSSLYKLTTGITSSTNPSGAYSHESTAAIVAALSSANVDWIDIPGWEIWKYEVDNPNAQHKIPRNKGNEATVFLTSVPILRHFQRKG
jgi:hypothetical protein